MQIDQEILLWNFISIVSETADNRKRRCKNYHMVPFLSFLFLAHRYIFNTIHICRYISRKRHLNLHKVYEYASMAFKNVCFFIVSVNYRYLTNILIGCISCVPCQLQQLFKLLKITLNLFKSLPHHCCCCTLQSNLSHVRDFNNF